MSELLRLDRVGIAVTNLKESGERLEKIGFERRREGSVGPEPDQGYPGLNARWAAYGLGQSEPIVLLEPLGPDGPIHEFLEQRGPGVQHIAFAVQDINAAGKALTALGIDLARQEPYHDTAGNLCHFIAPKDVPGVLVALLQSPDTQSNPFE